MYAESNQILDLQSYFNVFMSISILRTFIHTLTSLLLMYTALLLNLCDLLNLCLNVAVHWDSRTSREAVGKTVEDLLNWGSRATQKAGIPGGFPSASHLHGWGEQWRQDYVGNI